MDGSVPEISVMELSEKLRSGTDFTIIDVRETWELNYARVTNEHVKNIPMSEISRRLKEAFPTELRKAEAEIAVICHHGVRSANVVTWMQQNGWKNVRSVTGGIDAYAAQIDPTVGTY